MAQRRWTVILAGGFLALLLVVALTAAVTTYLVNRDDNPQALTSASPTAPAAPTASGKCPSDTVTAVPQVEPPADVQWRPLAAEVPMQLPFSSEYGPCVTDDLSAAGYARTPRGALVAASQILVRASLPGPGGEQTIRRQFVPGQWRDQLLENLVEAGKTPTEIPSVRLAAFRMTFYTESSARVELAVSYANNPGTYRIYLIDLTWSDADWRMNAPLGGDWSNAVTSATTLSGYVAWGPR